MSTPPPGPSSQVEVPLITSNDDVMRHFPLHCHVWRKDVPALKRDLRHDRANIESRDPFTRTPLMLAAVLGNRDAARVLLDSGASVRSTDKLGNTALEEAISNAGDMSSKDSPDFKILKRYFRYQIKEESVSLASFAIRTLFPKLIAMNDFYYEMSFELVSSVPFYSPSPQTIRVFKWETQVRIDSTFTDITMDGIFPKFVTAIQSHIYRIKEDSIEVFKIDHETRLYSIERYNLVCYVEQKWITSEAIYEALTHPISNTQIDVQHLKISAIKEGWIRSVDKTEVVDNTNCAVYKFSGILLRHRQRSNHLQAKKVEPKDVTELAYFKGEVNASPKLLMVRRTEDLSVNAWMTTDKTIPLTLEEHVLPILDLISIDAREFKIKRDVLLASSSFPAGFPLQLELPIIPLVLKARLKFSNIQAKDMPVSGISIVNGKLVLQTFLFAVPVGYQLIGINEKQ